MSVLVVKSPSYRADIDGLRAIAVAAVILCHIGVSTFVGGFLGVDVFFVISGYLIHRDLIGRLAKGRLSVPAFYGRRLRRTLPALLVAALLTVTVSTFVLLPMDLAALGRTLLAVLASVSNVMFLSQVGYFDVGAALKPLLHTWSLGVEEQFYLVAPLFALALRPLAITRRASAFAVTFAVAFALTLLVAAASPAAAFYLMPTRVFEFVIGAVLAEPWLPPLRGRFVAESATALGLAGLAFSFVAFDAEVPHPGWSTLLPCLCTAALIHGGAGGRTAVSSMLSERPFVFVGRISYSLYLYHWPILVLSRYAGLPATPTWWVGETLLLVALSYVSYRFVETPFRTGGSAWRRRAPALLPAGAAALAAFALLVVVSGGLPRRFSPEIVSLDSFSDFREHKPFREGRCFLSVRTDSASLDRQSCLALASDRPNVLILGDSHAAHLWSGLSATWPQINFLQATASGCVPGANVTGAPRCTKLMREMFGSFIPSHKLDALVLAGLWTEADIAPLRTELEALASAGQRVVVFGPLPRYDVPMATLLARAMLHHDLAEVARHRLADTAAVDAQMQKVISPLATYVSLWEAACPDNSCRLTAAPGIPFQFDYHHLTPQGSAALMKTVAAEHPGLFGGIASTGRLRLSNE